LHPKLQEVMKMEEKINPIEAKAQESAGCIHIPRCD